MGNKNREQVKIINVISDAVLIFISYLVAMALRYYVFDGVMSVNPFRSVYLVWIAVLSLIMAAGYLSYRRSYVTILIVNTIGALLVMAVFFYYRISNFSRLSIVLFWALSSVLVIAKHYFGHRVLARTYGGKRVAVIGNGKTAAKYREEAEKAYPDNVFVELSEDVDEIVIALEPDEVSKVPEILAFADKEGILVSMIPFYSEYIPSHPEIESIGDTKILNLRATPLDNLLSSVLKRLGDILLSFVAIVLTSPLMLVAVIGVKLSSPGPVFFKQERVGKNKKNFKMLKFRSMRVNAEENTGWSKDVDPRRTKFGSFIRKYSIDELPQFFNVFLGDMSMVGPRPEIPFYVRQFKESVPLYLVRQQVRPGITGWAQIHGLRGDTSIEERVKYDIWYIENWSLWLDIKILFITVFGGKFKNEEK